MLPLSKNSSRLVSVVTGVGQSSRAWIASPAMFHVPQADACDVTGCGSRRRR